MTARLNAYANKRLNEIVFPGSHDGGIYLHAKTNVQTQKLDIQQQAMAGIRFFDIRVAVHKVQNPGGAQYIHTAYHLSDKLVKGKKKDHQSMRGIGGWGGDLATILTQARAYVIAYPTEFIVLKFSKSFGWDQIVLACKNILGNYQFRQRINLNQAPVNTLAGHVITLFPDPEITKLVQKNQLNLLNPADKGFLPFIELYDKDSGQSKAYDDSRPGLQYFGKFSSTDKVKKNTKKQTKTIVSGGLTCNPRVVGMMYWTTTGTFGNIRDRNKSMWTYGNQFALQQTWGSGLKTAIDTQLGRQVHNIYDVLALRSDSGRLLKTFMPNIVMMDFSNRRKADTIYALNDVTTKMLEGMIDSGLEKLGR